MDIAYSRMKMNYIFGAGLSGLSCAFILMYLKKINNFFILSKGWGQNIYGPKYLRKTKNTEIFVEYLKEFSKIDIHLREFKVGYYYNGKINDNITKEKKIEYLKKTRGNDWQKFLSSGMNSSKNDIIGYRLKNIDLALFNLFENFIEIGEIEKIFLPISKGNFDVSFKVKNSDFHFNCNKIINTIPAPVFNYLCGDTKFVNPGQNIYIYEIYIKNSYTEVLLGKNYEEYDFIYIIDEDSPLYRITKINSDIYHIESLQRLNFEYLSVALFKNMKIRGEVFPFENPNIYHIGRYAEWDNNLRLHDTIDLIMNQDNPFGLKGK